MALVSASHLHRIVALVIASTLAPLPVVAQDDPIEAAMTRLAQGDSALHSGNLVAARTAYQEVLARFPTWWIPVLKSAVTAIAARAPAGETDPALARVRTLEPTGDYLALITLLLALERDVPDPAADLLPVPTEGADVVRLPLDPLSRRLAMARGLAFERSGRIGAAILEYRGVLARDPEVQAVRFRLARLLQHTGRTEEAQQLLREGQARSLFPPRWRAEGALLRGKPAN